MIFGNNYTALRINHTFVMISCEDLPDLRIGWVTDRAEIGELDGVYTTAELNDIMFWIEDPPRVFSDALNSVSALLSIKDATVSDVEGLLPVTVYVTPASDKSLRLFVVTKEA